jgi:hypothetical protein
MTFEDDDRPTMATREHVIPRAFGGPTEWWNVVAACRECNSLRGHMYALAFYWMRMQMTVKQIRKIRYERLAQEDEQYRLKTRENVIVIWFFFKRWFGAPVTLAAVERPHFV